MLDAKEFVKSQAKKWRNFKCPYCGYCLGYNGILVVTGQIKCRNCNKLINLNKVKRMQEKYKEKGHIHEKPQFDEKIIARVKPIDRCSGNARAEEIMTKEQKMNSIIHAGFADEAFSWAPTPEIPLLELKLH